MAKINLLEALKRVNKDVRYEAEVEELARALDISWFYPDNYQEIDKRLVSYPVVSWCCTDTHVGLNAVYFDDQLVGMTWQSARKNYVEVKWVSKEAAESVRAFLIQVMDKPEYDIINTNEQIDEFFAVSPSERLSDRGFYEGRPARALIWYDWYHPTTPEDCRTGDRAYYIKVPRTSEKCHHVEIELLDTKERKTVLHTEFVQRINIEDNV